MLIARRDHRLFTQSPFGGLGILRGAGEKLAVDPRGGWRAEARYAEEHLVPGLLNRDASPRNVDGVETSL